MATLLYIRSSIFGDDGQSSRLAGEFITQWQKADEHAEVITRDLIADPLPLLDAEVVAALMSESDQRTRQQQAIVDLADRLLTEVRSADRIVIAVPMYNFGVPAQMKAWIDLLARSGVTFKYTEQGPVGLLEDKPVTLIATRGGQYQASGQDHQIPFLQQFLGFIGLKNVKTVFAEGLNMGEELQAQALSEARETLLG